MRSSSAPRSNHQHSLLYQLESNSQHHHHQAINSLNSRQPSCRRSGLPYSSSSSSSTTINPNHTKAFHLQSPSSINPRPSKSLITVLPPSSLPANPPQVRSNTACSGYGPSSGFSRGILIPLYPTLAAQLAAISREYGLPSTGGMVVYLVEASPQAGDLAKQLVGGPKIGEEAWQILWSGIFEEETAEAFENEFGATELYDDHEEFRSKGPYNGLDLYNNTPDLEEVLGNELNHERIDQTEILEFPIPPPLDKRQNESTDSRLSEEELSSFHSNRSTQLSSLSSSTNTSDDSSKLQTPEFLGPSASVVDRFKNNYPSENPTYHGRSQSTNASSHLTQIPPIRQLSRGLPPRPSSASLSSQGYLPTSRLFPRPPSRRAPRSDRDSFTSLNSLRPRRIGAGTIVGKIEFDIDQSRSNGRWYDLWLNPPSIGRSGGHLSNLSTEDVSKPLLLPHLLDQKKKSIMSLRAHSDLSPTSPNMTKSSQVTYLSCESQQPADNTHSFLAFDDPSGVSDSDGRCEDIDSAPSSTQELDPKRFSKTTDQDRNPWQQRALNTADLTLTAVGDGKHFAHINRPSERTQDEKKEVGSSDPYHKTLNLVESQARRKASVDRADLSSPIKIGPRLHYVSPEAQNKTEEISKLNLGVNRQPSLADIRHTRTTATTIEKFTLSSPSNSSPSTNLSQSSAGSSTSPSSPGIFDRKNLLFPEGISSRRTSSMAMEANLNELEQTLASLSPRALRSCPPIASLPDIPCSPRQSAAEVSPISSSVGPQVNANNGLNVNGKKTPPGSSPRVGEGGHLTKKCFEPTMMEKEGEDSKGHRGARREGPQTETAVGNTEGYRREDVGEVHAPSSPVRSPKLPLSSSATTSPQRSKFSLSKKSADTFVQKAAGIVSARFRSHPRRRSQLDAA